MPTYLLHGFRWPRPLIRIHIVMQNLDDAAPGWLVAPATTLALLNNFKHLYPECMEHLSRLRFVEQFDPNDTSATGTSQPFAYVADLVEEIKLGVEIDEVRGKGVNNDQWAAVMELRDKIAPDEKVGWYIVVCGDEERPIPPPSPEATQESSAGASATPNRQSNVPSGSNEPVSPSKLQKQPPSSQEQPEQKGLKKLLSLRLGRSKSRTPLPGGALTHDDAGDISRGNPDGNSSTPSPNPSASASTPPLPDDVFELPATTPATSNGGTPPPPHDNFIPEIDLKSKYARMSQVPDYRATGVPVVEPKAAHMPPIEAINGNAHKRRSEQVASPRKFVPEKRTSLRRKSDMSGIEERSSRTSDVPAMPRWSGSPEFRMDRRVMSFPNVRSGAVSPLTYRSISPAGRSGAISPIGGQNPSPIRSGAVSPLTQDELPIAKPQRRTTLQLKQQRRALNLMLATQTLEARPSSADSDEELDEVIVMSPAVRAPTKHFLRRSGIGSSLVSPGNGRSPMNALDSIVEGDKKPYFGQDVNAEDVVAVNLENAFDRL